MYGNDCGGARWGGMVGLLIGWLSSGLLLALSSDNTGRLSFISVQLINDSRNVTYQIDLCVS